MLYLLTLLLLSSLLFLKECKSNVNCVTITGSQSDYVENSKSSAQCSNGYTLTSCGIDAPWGNIEGSYIFRNKCYARMGSDSIKGQYVKAKARCCSLESSITCTNHDSKRSAKRSRSLTVSHCSRDQTLTGYIYIYNIKINI